MCKIIIQKKADMAVNSYCIYINCCSSSWAVGGGVFVISNPKKRGEARAKKNKKNERKSAPQESSGKGFESFEFLAEASRQKKKKKGNLKCNYYVLVSWYFAAYSV